MLDKKNLDNILTTFIGKLPPSANHTAAVQTISLATMPNFNRDNGNHTLQDSPLGAYQHLA